jgi:hypothetical protein
MKRLALWLLPLFACTVQQGKIPVIDEVSVPATASLNADGTYHVDATVRYHDDDDKVSRVRAQVAALGPPGQYAATGNTETAVALKIVGTAPKGATTITFWVLDVEGNMSDPKNVTVTLQ